MWYNDFCGALLELHILPNFGGVKYARRMMGFGNQPLPITNQKQTSIE